MSHSSTKMQVELVFSSRYSERYTFWNFKSSSDITEVTGDPICYETLFGIFWKADILLNLKNCLSQPLLC